MPLQWHFFNNLNTGDWLSHLAREGLLGEPMAGSEEDNSRGFRYRQWPAGSYLKRMAESADARTRKLVADALRAVAESEHRDICHDGVDVLAALPAEESAPLADLAVAWLGRGERFGGVLPGEMLLKKLIEAKQDAAALRVARALLQIWEENGEVASLYGRDMYEHHLLSITTPLTEVCGEGALRLFVELLLQVGNITGRLKHDHHSSRPVADDDMARYDPYHALMSAVRRSAEMLVANDPGRMRNVIGILTRDTAKLLVRLAMHVLARNPSAAPELAERYLLDPDLVGQSWAQYEYAALARARFPSLSLEQQRAVLAIVDAMPDKYREVWRERFQQSQGRAPTAEDECAFEEVTVRDALWRWRTVLPPERREALDRIISERGDPDAWRGPLFQAEESPLSAAEFSNRSLPDVVALLNTWQPSTSGKQRHTVTALAQELRTAVGNDPEAYAADAAQFFRVKPIYVRRLLEGLQVATNNRRDFAWGGVLQLIEFTLGQHGRVIDAATLAEGDDESWAWACMTACELLAAGLRRGANGIGFEHEPQVRRLVFAALEVAPKHPEVEDFEARCRRSPFFVAQATLRGVAVELCILLLWWLTRDTSTAIGAAPREALQNLPEIRHALEAELAERSPDGRVPRSVMGRYLSWLFHFGEGWLRSVILAWFPADDDDLRRATWRSHLGHDERPLAALMSELHDCYAEDIPMLCVENVDRELRDLYQDRLTDHILLLHLWGMLPDDLLELFLERAAPDVRRHAMWFVGNQVSSVDAPDHVKVRGLAYWESRLAQASESGNPNAYRSELDIISQWCFHGKVDEAWLCEQLIKMFRAGFAPTDAFSVVDWLQRIAPRHVDLAVEALEALLRHPKVDQWAYMTQRVPIRAALSEGLAMGTSETIERVNQTIGYLSSIGETSYLDLVRSPAAE